LTPWHDEDCQWADLFLGRAALGMCRVRSSPVPAGPSESGAWSSPALRATPKNSHVSTSFARKGDTACQRWQSASHIGKGFRLRHGNHSAEELTCYRRAISSVSKKHRNQNQQRGLDCVVLWLFPTEDHAAWIAADLGEIPYDEYVARVHAAIEEARSLGQRVEVLYASVAEVLDCMERHEISNDPIGRAHAYGLLFAEKSVKTTPAM